MGIDPSLACTGWAIMEDDDVVVTGEIKPIGARGASHGEKLASLHGQFCKLLAGFGGEIAVEAPFFGRNAQVTISLSEVRGVLLCAAAQMEHTVASYSPSEVKIAIGVPGNASKEQVQRMIQARFHEAYSSDVSDAIAVAV